MSKALKLDTVPTRRKRARSDVFCNQNGRPFHGENWRKTIYRPLDPETKQIRLLVLLPSLYFDSDIRCYLGIHDLEQGGVEFNAISYVWGDKSERKSIHLNDFHIKIGLNAYKALRNIRRPQFSITLWIDSLCINQEDVLERNHQVTLMRDVYRQASRVWLSVCDPWPYVFTAITRLGAVYAIIRKSPDPSYDSTPPAEATLQGFKEAREEQWSSIARFLELPFWRRLWIVQEVALGMFGEKAYIMVGRECISYQVIAHAVVVLRMNSKIVLERSLFLTSEVTPYLRAFESCRAFAACSAVRRPFFRGYADIFTMQPYLEVSDERDRVYGLLALFPELDTQVDYYKTTEQVYEDAMVSLVNALGYLECMFYREYPGNNGEVLASWATDLRLRAHSSLWTWAQGLHKHYNASGNARLKVPLSRQRNAICVQGRQVSRLDATAAIGQSSLYEAASDNEWHCHMDRAMEFAMNLVCDRDNGMESFQRQVLECGRALHFDLLRDDAGHNVFCRMNGPQDFQDLSGDLKSFAATWIARSTLRCESNGRILKSSKERELFGSLAHQSIAKITLHKTRIAMDLSGHICIVPAATQLGDVIYLLAGSTVPFVLRPVADTKRSLFKVIGPAYVHGIMDGELVYDSPRRVSTGDPDAYDAAFDDIWLC